VFKTAVLSNAASVIVAHNHPSGDSTPSRKDIEVTKRLKQVGDVLGIEVIDHIVIRDGRYVSQKEKGMM
jgi:DNA repair protein RadC